MSLLSAANSSAPGPRHLLYLTASFVCSKFFCCSSAVFLQFVSEPPLGVSILLETGFAAI